MYVERAMYSLRMSFWTVPRRADRGTEACSATAAYRARRIGAVALIVIDVLTLSRGRSRNRVRMSSSVLTATPTFPTSPWARGTSESRPIWVGRSKATLRPSFPWERRYLNRTFVSSAVPKPAYCRIVQRRPRYIVACTPRVKGGSPGKPRRSSAWRIASSGGPTTTSRGRPPPVRPTATVRSGVDTRAADSFDAGLPFERARLVVCRGDKTSRTSEEDPFRVQLRPEDPQLALRGRFRRADPGRHANLPGDVRLHLIHRDAGMGGLQDHLLRVGLEPVHAEVRDDRGRPAAGEADPLPAAGSVDPARCRHVVDLLHELPRVLLHHDDRTLREGPDVVPAAGPWEADLRTSVVADDRRVEVPEPVDLRAADVADVHVAGLQEEAEDLREPAEHHAPGHEARVPDRQGRALRPCVDDPGLEDHHAIRGVGRLREHPAEHGQPRADECDFPVPDLAGRADRHELRGLVVPIRRGRGRLWRRVSSHSSPARSSPASRGVSRAAPRRASADTPRARRGRTPIRPPRPASPRGSRSAPHTPAGRPRPRRNSPGPGTDARRTVWGRSRPPGNPGRSSGSGPSGRPSWGRSPPRSGGSASPPSCPTRRLRAGPTPARCPPHRSAAHAGRRRPRGTRGRGRPSPSCRTGRRGRPPSGGGTTRCSEGRSRASTSRA